MYVLKLHISNKISDMKFGSKEVLREWAKSNIDGLIHFQEIEDDIKIKRYSKEIGFISKVEVIGE